MPLSVTLQAQRNSDALAARAETLVAADTTGLVARFRAHALGSVISSNVSAHKIVVFDRSGRTLDARAIFQIQQSGDRRDGLKAFRAAQGKWYVRRVRFEALWRRGREFFYGALNTGGMGTEGRYGPFCVVVSDPQSASPAALGVFPGNTAERYASVSGVVDVALARREVASWDSRADLATLELSAQAVPTPTLEWPSLVCSPRRFIEVVVAPAPGLESLGAVRMRGAYVTRLEDLEGRALAGEALTDVEQWELQAFTALQRWRRAHAVNMERVG